MKNKYTSVTIDIEAMILEIRLIATMQDLIPISERVAIAINIENKLGKHQGRRRDLASDRSKTPDIPDKFLALCSEVNGVTDAIAAKLAKFSSRDTYRRAKVVVTKGIPELIQAMDNKKISISKAASIAKLMVEQQQYFLEHGSKEDDS